MTSNQLAFFNDVNEKEIQTIVIKELRLFRALKVQIENMEERNETGVTHLYPSVRTTRIDNHLKVSQMENALENSLDKEEREIIELKYLSGERIKDINIYMDLGMKKDRYYELKQQAIRYLATALGII